jgi:hypothetical protein
MQLIEVFLPLADNEGQRFEAVKHELAERFGGVTVYPRSPASGLWTQSGKEADELVVFEVMTEHLDETWWRRYRGKLEAEFRQEKLIVRAFTIQLL